MNILILSHTYPDIQIKWRGIFVKQQALALAEEHNVTVVYFKVDYSVFAPFKPVKAEKTISNSLTEYIITVGRSFPVLNQLKYLRDTYLFIRKEILAKQKIDIIHAHQTYPGGFLASIIQSRTGIPCVITEHSRIRNYFRSIIHKMCVRYALRNSAGFIAVSNSLKQEVDAFFPRKIYVTGNITDTEGFYLSQRNGSETCNIGYMGSMNNPNKALDILLKSVSLLKGIDFTLHIAGTGKLIESYKKLASELGIIGSCRFYGEIDRKEISAFFSSIDIFVLTSRYETFGIVLVEAMASGVPVIATECGGPLDIVVPGTGLLVPVDDIEKLKAAITELWSDRTKYDKEFIRKHATEKFGKETFKKNIGIIYNEIIKSPEDEK